MNILSHKPVQFTIESRAAERFLKMLPSTLSEVTLLLPPASLSSHVQSIAVRLAMKFWTQHGPLNPEIAGMYIFLPETWGDYWMRYHIHCHTFPSSGVMPCGFTVLNN